MRDESLSAERKLAMQKMQEALKAAQGRNPERGVEMMLQVVEMDPRFVEPRLWLAEFYLANDRKQMAVSQYEEILRIEPENEEVWAKLRELDPMTAERLYRMQHVAPDPFVAQRAKVDMSDLDDFDEETEEEAEPEAGAPFAGGRADEDVFVDEEVAEQYYEPLPWEHEQEREYRDKLDAAPAFVKLLNGYADLWYDQTACAELLGDCTEGDATLAAINEKACSRLGAETTRVLLVEEWLPVPLAMPIDPPTVVLSARAPEVFTMHELTFWLAWSCHNLLGGAGEYTWPAEQVLGHGSAFGPLAVAVQQAAAARVAGWNEGLSEEELGELARNAQAWEMRAVMSADRAGLLVVGEEAVARRAIAGASVDLKRASSITSTQFLGIFRAKPVKELARISLKSNPWCDPQYAAYRSHFLRWWATTEDFKKLQAQLSA